MIEHRLELRGGAEVLGLGRVIGDLVERLAEGLVPQHLGEDPVVPSDQLHHEPLDRVVVEVVGRRKVLGHEHHHLQFGEVGEDLVLVLQLEVFVGDARFVVRVADLRELLGLGGRLALGSHADLGLAAHLLCRLAHRLAQRCAGFLAALVFLVTVRR